MWRCTLLCMAIEREDSARGITTVVVPAAGMGTRFLPATKTVPKELLPVVDTPGIAEGMRACSMAVTPRAMLSRAVCAQRGSTLVINLPGSERIRGLSRYGIRGSWGFRRQ